MSRNNLSSPFRHDFVGKTNLLGATRAISRIENNNRYNNRNAGKDSLLITKEVTKDMNKNKTIHTTLGSPTRAPGLKNTNKYHEGLGILKASVECQLVISSPNRLQTIIEIEEDAEEELPAKDPRVSASPLTP